MPSEYYRVCTAVNITTSLLPTSTSCHRGSRPTYLRASTDLPGGPAPTSSIYLKISPAIPSHASRLSSAIGSTLFASPSPSEFGGYSGTPATHQGPASSGWDSPKSFRVGVCSWKPAEFLRMSPWWFLSPACRGVLPWELIGLSQCHRVRKSEQWTTILFAQRNRFCLGQSWSHWIPSRTHAALWAGRDSLRRLCQLLGLCRGYEVSICTPFPAHAFPYPLPESFGPSSLVIISSVSPLPSSS